VDDQGSLFDLPGPPPRMATRPAAAVYTRHRPVARWLCDDCTATIHRLGQAEAPLPRPVRWRRTRAGEPPLMLCDGHRAERQGGGG
jgi:hypothetical protein